MDVFYIKKKPKTNKPAGCANEVVLSASHTGKPGIEVLCRLITYGKSC